MDKKEQCYKFGAKIDTELQKGIARFGCACVLLAQNW